MRKNPRFLFLLHGPRPSYKRIDLQVSRLIRLFSLFRHLVTALKCRFFRISKLNLYWESREMVGSKQVEHKSKIYIIFDQFSIPSCTLWARVAICHLSPNRSLKVKCIPCEWHFLSNFREFWRDAKSTESKYRYLCSEIFIWPMQIWMTLENGPLASPTFEECYFARWFMLFTFNYFFILIFGNC